MSSAEKCVTLLKLTSSLGPNNVIIRRVSSIGSADHDIVVVDWTWVLEYLSSDPVIGDRMIGAMRQTLDGTHFSLRLRIRVRVIPPNKTQRQPSDVLCPSTQLDFFLKIANIFSSFSFVVLSWYITNTWTYNAICLQWQLLPGWQLSTSHVFVIVEIVV